MRALLLHWRMSLWFFVLVSLVTLAGSDEEGQGHGMADELAVMTSNPFDLPPSPLTTMMSILTGAVAHTETEGPPSRTEGQQVTVDSAHVNQDQVKMEHETVMVTGHTQQVNPMTGHKIRHHHQGHVRHHHGHQGQGHSGHSGQGQAMHQGSHQQHRQMSPNNQGRNRPQQQTRQGQDQDPSQVQSGQGQQHRIRHHGHHHQHQGQVNPSQIPKTPVNPGLLQGQRNQGQMNSGQMHQGQVHQGQVHQGQMQQGQKHQSQVHLGQVHQGHVNAGPTRNTAQTNQGQRNPGQTLQGQRNPGQDHQGQGHHSQVNPNQMHVGQHDVNSGQVAPGQGQMFHGQEQPGPEWEQPGQLPEMQSGLQGQGQRYGGSTNQPQGLGHDGGIYQPGQEEEGQFATFYEHDPQHVFGGASHLVRDRDQLPSHFHQGHEDISPQSQLRRPFHHLNINVRATIPPVTDPGRRPSQLDNKPAIIIRHNSRLNPELHRPERFKPSKDEMVYPHDLDMDGHRDGPEMEERIRKHSLQYIPADILRDYPGLCFSTSTLKLYYVGESWHHRPPQCGFSTCLFEHERMIERVRSCAKPPVRVGIECYESPRDMKDPFPFCCSEYFCYRTPGTPPTRRESSSAIPRAFLR